MCIISELYSALANKHHRAKANGLLNVENPVTQALHEGRFEELPDDTDSD